MRFEQVKRFILPKKVFWGQRHFNQQKQQNKLIYEKKKNGLQVAQVRLVQFFDGNFGAVIIDGYKESWLMVEADSKAN